MEPMKNIRSFTEVKDMYIVLKYTRSQSSGNI